MNRERAINILLEHAERSTDPNDDAYAVEIDSLTAAILALSRLGGFLILHVTFGLFESSLSSRRNSL